MGRSLVFVVTVTSEIVTLSCFFPTQELMMIVKALQGELHALKGTNHVHRCASLCNELKAYCQAIDFNDTVALNKLREVLEACQSKAEETTRFQHSGIG